MSEGKEVGCHPRVTQNVMYGGLREIKISVSQKSGQHHKSHPTCFTLNLFHNRGRSFSRSRGKKITYFTDWPQISLCPTSLYQQSFSNWVPGKPCGNEWHDDKDQGLLSGITTLSISLDCHLGGGKGTPGSAVTPRPHTDAPASTLQDVLNLPSCWKTSQSAYGNCRECVHLLKGNTVKGALKICHKTSKTLQVCAWLQY